jgi:hypothetical protein
MEERSKSAGSGSMAYVPEGTTKFRPYLDKDGEPYRTGWRHKIGKLSIPCMGRDQCKICERLSEISDSWKGAWKFGGQEYTLMYAWIFEASDANNRYLKLNEPILLMGNAKLANEVSFQIKDNAKTDEELISMFNPFEPGLMWQLRVDRDNKVFSLGYASRKGTMDALPESLPALSDCYFKAGQLPNPDKEAEFLNEMETSYQKFLSLQGSESVNQNATIPNKASYNEDANKTSSNEDTNSKPAKESSGVFTGQRVHTKDIKEVAVCFGHHDSSGTNKECLLCKAENLCEAETRG